VFRIIEYINKNMISTQYKETQCAGFVVICKPERKVLLVSTHNDNWGFPKGKREKKEPFEECAFRELKEETGLTRNQIEPIDMQNTSFNEITDKKKPSVRLYVATTQALIKPVVEDEDELSKAEWVDFDEAITRLTIKNRYQILKCAIDKVYL
jgi:8-oxo-dGTP pyrophosphatase MutT (NUDIX family)